MKNDNINYQKKFILYVEDEDVQAKVFSKIIENEVKNFGYEVVVFNNGTDFIDLLNSNNKNYKIEQFGLVLLDLSMFDFSGFDMLKEAKIKAPKSPIAILSAREDLIIKKQTLDLGARDYFVKGKNLAELDRLRNFIIEIMRGDLR
jgi:DNA-binding response OmpR family regulator